MIIREGEDRRQLEEEGERDKGDVVGLVMMAHSPLFLLECLPDPHKQEFVAWAKIKQKSCGAHVFTTFSSSSTHQ